MFCVIIYNNQTENENENYELKFTTNGGKSWKTESIVYFYNNDFIHYELLARLNRLIDLGYNFIGIRNGGESIW